MRMKIDMKTYPKRNQYNWFHTFDDPTYGFDVDIDVDEIVKLTKERKHSFFPYFYYVILLAVKDIDEMRLREVNNEVYLYDEIHPTFTVMTDYGIYQNCGFEMIWDFQKFYQKTREIIKEAKSLPITDELDRYPVCSLPNVLYTTCIPILSLKGMTHPTNAKNYDSLSVPRICWDKYRLDYDNHYHLTLNITVSHTLVDGFPLARCFNKIKEYCKKAKEIFLWGQDDQF